METKKLMIAATTAIAAVVGGLLGAAVTQSGSQASAQPIEPVPATAVPRTAEAAEKTSDKEHESRHDEDCSCDYEWEFEEGDWEPSAEEIAEINAETDALVAHLQGLGFSIQVEEDEFGIRYLEFEGDEATEKALWEAVDAYDRQLFLDEIAGWSDDERAEWNAEIDELVAELAEEGVVVETEEIAPGVRDIVWTEQIEEALWGLESHECDAHFDEYFYDDWAPSEAEIAEINAETDALVAHLEGLGFTVVIEEDEFGVRYVEFDGDEATEKALWEAVDAYYEQLWLDEIAGWTDEERAEWNSEVNAFVAELAEEGIIVQTEEIAPGVIDIVWSDELERMLDEDDFEEV